MGLHDLDSLFRIDTHRAGMAADVVVLPGADPDKLDNQLLLALITGEGIQFTADLKSRLPAIIAEVRQNALRDHPKPQPFKLVEGQAPQQGCDAHIDIVADFDPGKTAERLAAPADEAPHQSAPTDFYQRSVYKPVPLGAVVATVVEPIAGQDGVDIFGRSVAAKHGREIDVHIDHTLIRQKDGSITAAAAGLLVWAPPLLRISTKLDVPRSIDFAIGNIDFPGDVVVRGAVRDGFKVACVGSLEVTAQVEGAIITVGGSGVFRAGIAAKDRGQLTIGQDCNAKYLNSVRGTIGRDLAFDRELVNSDLTIGRSIIAPTGTISGGTIRVANSVTLATLGAGSAKTHLYLGWLPPLHSLWAELTATLPELEARVAKCDDRLNQLKSINGKLSHSQAEELTELEFAAAKPRSMISMVKARLVQLQTTLNEHASIDLVVYTLLTAGTTIYAGEWTLTVYADLKGPARLTLDKTGQPRWSQAETGADLPTKSNIRVTRDITAGPPLAPTAPPKTALKAA